MAVSVDRPRSRVFVSFTGSAAPAAARLIDSLAASLPPYVGAPNVVTRPYGQDAVPARESVPAVPLDACGVWLIVLAETWDSGDGGSADAQEGFAALCQDLEAVLADSHIVVMWVLVEGAEKPDRPALPPPLQRLADCEAFHLDDLTWDRDVTVLEQALPPHVRAHGVVLLCPDVAPASPPAPPTDHSRARQGGDAHAAAAARHVREVQESERRAHETAARAEPLGGPTNVVDEHVQFTVYRHASMQPERWYPMLVFAHLSERRPDAPPDEPDPIAEVQAQAAQILGDLAGFRTATEDSAHPVLRDGELRFVPHVEGVAFNPPERRFLWTESVHREDFRMRADSGLHGRVARGAVSVYAGNLLLADIQVSIKINWQATDTAHDETHARPYRRIFASYSHRDTAIVEEFEAHAAATGDKYLRDVVTLRAGEVWDARLTELIGQADIFQLFWSWNALASPLVRKEWQQALSLNRAHFVRPVYWEEPLPEQGGLPPAQLRRLHFQRVFPRTARGAPAPEASPAPTMLPADGPPALDPALAARAPGLMRFVRYGSIAAAAVLAVGLYVAAFDRSALPSPLEPSVDIRLPPDTSTGPSHVGPPNGAPGPPTPGESPAEPSAERGRSGAGGAAAGGGRVQAGRRGGGTGTQPPGAAGSSGTGAAPRPSSGQPVVLPAPPLPVGPTTPDAAEPPLPSPPGPSARGAAAPVERAIGQTFRAYERAWAALDSAALGRVWTMSAAEARQTDELFTRARAADVTVRVYQIDMQGPTRAVARAEETRRLQGADGRSSAATFRRTFYLERRDGAWIIVTIG